MHHLEAVFTTTEGGVDLISGSALRLPKSGTPDRDSSNGFQALASYRHGHRRLRSAAEPWTRASAERDDPGCGDTAARVEREGTPWRSLSATPGQASGATLRRCLRRWAERGLLAKVHALLVGMLRGHPDLILDTCSVRAKRAGDLTGLYSSTRRYLQTQYVAFCRPAFAQHLGWC